MYNKNKIQTLKQELLEGCPWPGQILTAVGVDANNGIYPVAYAIVEAFGKASWYWFLNLLRENLGIEANFNYTFISNRQKIKGGMYKDMLWNATKATIVGEFNKNMGELKSYNFAAYDWLMKILAEQWSKSYFSGGARQATGAINVSSQAVGLRNASSQATGSSQPSAAPSTTTGASKASSQAAGVSQPSATPSIASQGPSQHSA
ncbi:hypothetical protein Tco_0072593 [Tanacetum coccineum]